MSGENNNSTDLETRCIHGGKDFNTEGIRPISMPIYQTASFSHIEPGHNGSGFDYTRESNPTRSALEKTVTALEGAADSLAFTSGMAAINTVFELFSPGDHIICGGDLYGGTVRLMKLIAEKNGIKITCVDSGDISRVKEAVEENTRAIYIETPGNPMMKITDIKECACISHGIGALLIVDNTFLSPYFQNPIELGADIVVHSGSKFLSGHNDTIAGFLCMADKSLADKIRLLTKTIGNALSPFDSWLVMRGIKTLAVRMEREQENAIKLVDWFLGKDFVKKVYYPGLENHPGYEINLKQARGSGAMISVEVDSKERALAILQNVKVLTFAESLGGTESLVTYPCVQTHPDVPVKVREALGINDRLLRFSIGLESVSDLMEDIEQAAKKV
ncbi:MAG: PLP-dependent transferase [Lachnospiraceae bacterium]|nr:PLP-dependent transferase [Lachnospiraceae bacterium]